MKEPIDNLEGPPPTPEERAAMARELDRVAPTPADKFGLMLGQRPTPRTDEVEYYFVNHDSCAGESLKRVIDGRDVTWDKSFEGNACPSDFARQLERELAEAREQRDRLAEACRWAQRELGKHTRPSPIDKALAALKGGTSD